MLDNNPDESTNGSEKDTTVRVEAYANDTHLIILWALYCCFEWCRA